MPSLHGTDLPVRIDLVGKKAIIRYTQNYPYAPEIVADTATMTKLAILWLETAGYTIAHRDHDPAPAIIRAVARMSEWRVEDHLECVFCREWVRVDWDNPDRKAALAAARAAISHDPDCAWVAAKKLTE